MSLPADYFAQMYAGDDDPWGFRTRWYEERKRAVTLAALDRPRYRRAFEPGCSVGVLTQQLAERCDQLIATDIAPTALEQARARCESLPHVELELRGDDEFIPPGRFDLIVFSEIGYYFSRARLAQLAAGMADALEPDGEFLAVHWLGDSEDHVLHGDEVHEVLEEALPLTHWPTARNTWSERKTIASSAKNSQASSTVSASTSAMFLPRYWISSVFAL
jgi:SAM-dependent methyltransferase